MLSHLSSKKIKVTSFRDLIIVVICLVLVVVGVVNDWPERFVDFLYKRQKTLYADIVVSVFFANMLFLFYVLGRNRENKQIEKEQSETEAHLKKTG